MRGNGRRDLVLIGLCFVVALVCHLEGLTRLELLLLNRSQVTDEGVKKLQQALPNCQIIR
jgi:hypothetical protein